MKYLARAWKFMARPLPALLALLVIGGGVAVAAAVLPTWSSGTATMGPGGIWDLGSTSAAGNAQNGLADPQIFAGTQGINISIQMPSNGVNNGKLNILNCLNLSCGNLQTTANITNNQAQFNTEVMAAPTGTAFNQQTPGPVPGCYLPTGLQCPDSWHSTYGVLAPTITGVCANNSVCVLRAAGSSTGLTGNAQFDIPVGAGDVVCSTFSPPGYNITTGESSGGTAISIQSLYNQNGTAEPDGTGLANIRFYCVGQ